MKHSLSFILLLLASLCAQPCMADGSVDPIVVVVNVANPVTGLSLKEVRNIYQGRQLKWPNGQRIHAINRPQDSAIRKQFFAEVLQAEPQQVFFQTGSPIPFKTMEVRSDRAVRKFISRITNSISYLRRSSVDDGVRIVFLLEEAATVGAAQ